MNSERFNKICDDLKKGASKLFSKLSKVFVEQLPKSAGQYVGVFLKPGHFIPCLGYDSERDIYSIRFLSDYIVQLIACACRIENKQALEREKFDYLIAEALMCHGLMEPTVARSLHKCFEYNDWKFYGNNNFDKSLASPKFPLCDKQIDFPSMYLEKNVSELEERALYKSSLHNGALYDALLVSHSEHRVYVFQSSNLQPSEHKLTYTTLNKVMTRLHFDENPKYKLVYVYCHDRTSKIPTKGCKIENPDGISEGDKKQIDNRIDKMLVARVCYYPNLEKMPIK